MRALTVTEPLAVVAGAVKVSGSLLASVAVTEPVTTPVLALGVPTVDFVTGMALVGEIVTVTALVVDAPWESVTVTVTVSVLAAVVAPTLAAACREVDVGV